MRANRFPAARGLKVRPARSEDLSQLFDIYTAYNAVRPIAVQRSPAYWRDWIGLNPEKLSASDPPLVAQNSTGRIVGYIVYQVNFYPGHQITEDYAYVSEFGALQDAGIHIEASDRRSKFEGAESGINQIALALLEAVAGRALSAGKRELHLSIALDPPIRAAISKLCESTTENVTESGMVRLLHQDSLLRSFLFEWNDRWIGTGRPRGEIVFETPYGRVRVDASGRFLTVAPVETPSGESDALSHSVLFGLLFGMVDPERVALNSRQIPLLAALFPVQNGVYWSADGF